MLIFHRELEISAIPLENNNPRLRSPLLIEVTFLTYIVIITFDSNVYPAYNTVTR